MKLVFRCDGDGRIGGGHVVRCLTLAQAARARGWDVHFVMASGGFSDRVRRAEFPITAIPPTPHQPDPAGPAHANWLSAPWQRDAEITASSTADADWLIWDHYGLDARWVRAVGAQHSLAFDDLDDRDLVSDVVLDLTRLSGQRSNTAPVQLVGPTYAPLRPDFAKSRSVSLARRNEPIRKVIVMPGLADAAGLAPSILHALDGFPDLIADVVMGEASQSRAKTEAIISRHTLTIDPPDLTERMARADICIGASGMTNWERCALGLPTVAIAVADNQLPGLRGLAARGAVIPLTLSEAQNTEVLKRAIQTAIATSADLSANASKLCDGLGANRVLDAIDFQFRVLSEVDAERLYGWRNSQTIRAASHDSTPLDPAKHLNWVRKVAQRTDGVWLIYEEAGKPIGHANAVTGNNGWTWSFYLGEPSPPGTGSRMMARFMDYLRDQGAKRVIGEVKETNAASIALHRRLGFDQIAQRDGVLVFARAIGETDL